MLRSRTPLLFIAVLSSILLMSCSSENNTTPEDPATYDPTPYALDTKGLPPPPGLPADNPLTVQGVQLGRMLFYEKMLSKDGSQACADCHVQADAFTDIRRFSIGVEGLPGKRQAMSVFNMAWRPPGRTQPGAPNRGGFFWDGRAELLRHQSLMPIQDPLEMNETLENAIAKLQSEQRYRDQFIRAFDTDTITEDLMSKAMEQFMFTIVSGNSKFDQVQRGSAQFTESEQRGHDLYFAEVEPSLNQKGAECFHCHGGVNFSNNQFMNNGLDAPPQWSDLGRYEVTGNDRDRARFLATSLRNIELTAPYMHDGRFQTLEEVIDHYNTGVRQSPTLELPLMQFNVRPGGLGLNEQDKQDLVAFLKTLTDQDLLTEPEYAAP